MKSPQSGRVKNCLSISLNSPSCGLKYYPVFIVKPPRPKNLESGCGIVVSSVVSQSGTLQRSVGFRE